MQELKQPPVSDCSVQYHFTCYQWLDFADKSNQDALSLSFKAEIKKNKNLFYATVTQKLIKKVLTVISCLVLTKKST